MDQNQNPSGPHQFKVFLSWVVFVARALAASVEVFLHRSRTFGERYMGLQAAAVLLIVPLYAGFWEGYDMSWLARFYLAYIAMCLVVRIGGVMARRRGGQREHTYYTGYPRIMRFTGRLSERTVKMIVEPMLVFVIGAFTLPASEPLGGYLMLAAVALSLSVNLSASYEHRRVLDMHDAAIDQKDLVEQFRDMRGDRF